MTFYVGRKRGIEEQYGIDASYSVEPNCTVGCILILYLKVEIKIGCGIRGVLFKKDLASMLNLNCCSQPSGLALSRVK